LWVRKTLAAARPRARGTITNKARSKAPLQGHRILIVENDYLLAKALGRQIEDAGAKVVGPAWSRDAGLLLADGESFDGAVLDAELGGESAEPIATMLATRGIPFVVVTGLERQNLPTVLREAPCLGKPMGEADLIALVADSMRIGRR
jgi:DNA-binding response OmpR family regulator